jgi:2'-5' RNA ligase superfamily
MPSELYAFSVPFRDLAPAVDEWRERTCATKPSHGVLPHVTLLIPAPPDADGAAETLASLGPFEVAFARFGRFPGTLWLAPDPVEPFVEMTRSLVARFPGHEPYGGEFAGITPHLTVAEGEELSAAEAALEPLLPLRSRASSVVLFEQLAPDRWCENAEFAL